MEAENRAKSDERSAQCPSLATVLVPTSCTQRIGWVMFLFDQFVFD